VVACGYKAIGAFDGRSGNLCWRFEVKGDTTFQTGLYSGRVYLWREEIPSDSSMETFYYVLESSTGQKLQEVHAVEQIFNVSNVRPTKIVGGPVVTETRVFLADRAGRIWALDRETGRPVWHHKGRDIGAVARIRLAGNYLYVVTDFTRQINCYEQR
jgi:outer membrane protein assembly factor BamB